MANKIRRLCIGAEPKNQFIYFVGGDFPLYIEGEKRIVTVESIEESEHHYFINIKTNGEIQLWKKIPKNNITSEEYLID